MTRKLKLQMITMNILPYILGSKGNQAMKFDQLIEYDVRNIFFQSHTDNEAGKLVSDLFFVFFLKRFIYGKSKWSPP